MQTLSPLIILIHQGNSLYTCINALLESVNACRNFHIAFINFAKTTIGTEVLEDKLSSYPRHYTIYDVPLASHAPDGTPIVGEQLNGVLGYILNRAMLAHDCDFAFILRDCDELHPRYLVNVSNHFMSNQYSINCCYSHVIPMTANRTVIAHGDIKRHRFNYGSQSMNANGMNRIHITQLAWRLDLCRKKNCLFEANSKSGILANDINGITSFTNKLYETGGAASYTGGISHYFNEHAPDVIIPDPDLAAMVTSARHFMLASDFNNARLACVKALSLDPRCLIAQEIMAVVSPPPIKEPPDVVGGI